MIFAVSLSQYPLFVLEAGNPFLFSSSCQRQCHLILRFLGLCVILLLVGFDCWEPGSVGTKDVDRNLTFRNSKCSWSDGWCCSVQTVISGCFFSLTLYFTGFNPIYCCTGRGLKIRYAGGFSDALVTVPICSSDINLLKLRGTRECRNDKHFYSFWMAICRYPSWQWSFFNS